MQYVQREPETHDCVEKNKGPQYSLSYFVYSVEINIRTQIYHVAFYSNLKSKGTMAVF